MDFPTKFVSEPSRSLKCPCCDGVFRSPVISTSCGHTFCKDCSVHGHGIGCCPLDETPFDGSSFVANRALQGQLDELKIYCRHGLMRYDSDEDFVIDENGCPEKITFSQREEHENLCEFALIPCPNSSNFCGKFRRKDLEEHLKHCDRIPCDYSRKGCSFFGTYDEVVEHQSVCPRRDGDLDSAIQVEVGNNGLSSKVVTKKIQYLSEKVASLENDKEVMTNQMKQAERQIKSLKSQVDYLTNIVEQIRMAQAAAVRDRIGSQSTSDMLELYEAHKKRSISSSSSSQATSPTQAARSLSWSRANKKENWKMPFTFACIGTFRGHTGTIWALASRGNLLFSAGADLMIKVWDIHDIKNSKGCIQTMIGHRGDIHVLCVGDRLLYSGGSDKCIRTWDLSNYQAHFVKEDAHDNIVCAIVYTGKYIFSSSFASIKVWKSVNLELVHSISDLKHWVRALVCDRNRERVFSGSHNTVYIWDANNFTLKGKVDHSHGSVYSLGVTQQYLIIGTYNRNTHLYDANTYQEAKGFNGHVGTVTGMAPSPSGNFLFTSSSDHTVQVWDLAKLLPIQVLSRHEASVNCVTLRGDMLFSGSEDREIKVYVYCKVCENTFLGGSSSR
ncbi:E3 ubiquitin-protein ligase TRAF7-like [Rhopilema esculentum]|uniref:E3 ubiquitin-protein ligase TRAF7-like n=1 Tax=Rhopilema esculentum TaxID=499914 RepID=UPI0031DCC683